MSHSFFNPYASFAQQPNSVRSHANAWIFYELECFANDSLKQVVIVMTHFPHGAACVLDSSGRLIGLITDGDVRRALQAHDDIRDLNASAVMTANPSTIAPDASLQQALRLMEDRPSQISVLPVIDPGSGVCLGLLRLHDLYQSGRK